MSRIKETSVNIMGLLQVNSTKEMSPSRRDVQIAKECNRSEEIKLEAAKAAASHKDARELGRLEGRSTRNNFRARPLPG